MTTIDGTLLTSADGTPMLRFERRYPHPIAKVWRALTDPQEMRGWFPQRVEFDPDLRVGAKVRYSDDPNMPGESFERRGPRARPADAARALVGHRPAAHGAARRRRRHRPVFTDTFSERDNAARDATGWHVCLDELSDRLGGSGIARRTRTRAGPSSTRSYVERFDT